MLTERQKQMRERILKVALELHKDGRPQKVAIKGAIKRVIREDRKKSGGAA